MNRPSIVLFDLGNVLIHFTPKAFWQTLGLDDHERTHYEALVGLASHKFERGEISTLAFFDELFSGFRERFNREKLRAAVSSVLTTPIDKTEDLVRRVASNVPAVLVSNTNELHYAYCLRVVPSLRFLSKHYLSFQLHTLKPETAFYKKVIGESQMNPSSMIFVDDVEENVKGAQAAGMVGVQFRGVAKLEDELKDLGIL